MNKKEKKKNIYMPMQVVPLTEAIEGDLRNFNRIEY